MPNPNELPNNEESKPPYEWLTKDETMVIMKIKPGLLYKYIKYHGLKVSKVESVMRFLQSDIDDFWLRHRK